MTAPIRLPASALKIRYIKLGREGMHWPRCRDENIIWLGFDSGLDEVRLPARHGQWDEIYNYWCTRSKTPRHHTNQTREFFEDCGETLWVTFQDGCLYYAFSDGLESICDTGEDVRASFKRTDAYGWRNVDANHNPLRIDNLSGRLTKTAAYRQTICKFSEEVEGYLRRCLAAKVNPLIVQYNKNREKLISDLEAMISSLTWHDFEVLVELIFVQSGLRRVSRTGGSKKTSDIDLRNPVTWETAFVQVKSRTSQSELDEYIERKCAEKTDIDKMYFVYHTGKASTALEDVIVWGCNDVANQVYGTGLADWVVSKSK